ncbi:MAPEG family protein [Amphiplicatus metriothermophilus]|uniref:MAPEG family protein n=1 Tax=Amphiplicatus metriothermophilus TaxID=1519374 RepID=A0A239PIG8_9PROT|nr:MAPEG family protein [Amphiplicatus metriothermophilus]MBB5518064.1 putative MAPEG superfamily protein [Amphiplicatus metriothermophilus]SNT67602.1 MAPEG family protein [Amphiplicatus metriothermophilus]
METAYFYVGLSGLLTILLWTPYILARVFAWGPWKFITNYPEGFPAREPEPPLWAQRAKRAHLNMVETMPAFLAVVIAADYVAGGVAGVVIGAWAQVFFFARVLHAVVYALGVPFLRTPVYLVSWAAIVMIGAQMFR